jgi:hypothetical protein
MQLIHFLRSLTSIARMGLALVMVALTLLGSAHRAAAASNPVITPYGSGFKFHATNSVAVEWWVEAGTKPPVYDANGNLVFPSGSRAASMAGGSSSTTFDTWISGLAPNTFYYYILRAGSSSSQGTLGTTLHRNVTVIFNAITVTDDSDSTGQGELTYNFKVNGVYRSALTFHRATNSGDTFNLNRSVSNLLDGGASIPVQVEVQDDDCEFSTCVMEPPDFKSGSNSDNDWTTATTKIDFFNPESNSFTKTVPYSAKINLGSYNYLGFKGTVTVNVSYFA